MFEMVLNDTLKHMGHSCQAKNIQYDYLEWYKI